MKYAHLGTTLSAAFIAVSAAALSPAHAAAVNTVPKPAEGCDKWHMSDDERQQCYTEWNASDSPADRLAVERKYNHAAKEDVKQGTPEPSRAPVDAAALARAKMPKNTSGKPARAPGQVRE